MNNDKPLGVKIIGTVWIISGVAVYISILQYFVKPIDFSVIKLKQWARLATIIITTIGIPAARETCAPLPYCG